MPPDVPLAIPDPMASIGHIMPMTHASKPDSLSLTRNLYLDALLRADVATARTVAEEALACGVSIRELYLSVFQWALYEVGHRWQTGRATVAQEHLATATTQTLMARLWHEAVPSAGADRRAVVTATQNDFHALGPRFVADFLEGAGWTVLDLGAATPTVETVRLVQQVDPSLVCLSTTMRQNLSGAREAVLALRALPGRPLIAVGGQAYDGDRELALSTGADLFAGDAAAFLDELRARLPAGVTS